MTATPEQFRQKAREARRHMDRSPDPFLRSMWRDIAEQYEYLAEHVWHRDWQWSGHSYKEMAENGPSRSPRSDAAEPS